VEFQYLLIVDLQQHPMIDPDSTVSCRALTLEHAQHWLSFFLKELASTCIRKAPQLPVIWQVSRTFREPRCKQQVQIPSLLKIFQCSVAYVSGNAMNIKRKPLKELISPEIFSCRTHTEHVRN